MIGAIVPAVLFVALAAPLAAAAGEDVTWVVADEESEVGIYLNGEQVDLTDARYQDRAANVKLDPDGATIHLDWNGITVARFFATIGWSLDAECLRTDAGARYCERDGALRAYLDGASIAPGALAAHELVGGERIALVYDGPARTGPEPTRPVIAEGVSAIVAGVGLAAWILVRTRLGAVEGAWAPSRAQIAVAAGLVLAGSAGVAAAVTVLDAAPPGPAPRAASEGSVVLVADDEGNVAIVHAGGAPLPPPPDGWPAGTALEAVRGAVVGHARGDAFAAGNERLELISILKFNEQGKERTS